MTSLATTTTKMLLINAILLVLWCSFSHSTVQSFTITQFPPTRISPNVRSTAATSTQLYFFGNGPKDDGSPGDYVCKVRQMVQNLNTVHLI